MKRISFGPDAAQPIPGGDRRLTVARLATSGGRFFTSVIYLEPGARLVRRPTEMAEMLVVMGGRGWVRLGENPVEPVAAGEAIVWQVGEVREAGTEAGMSLMLVQYPAGGPRRQFTAGGTDWSVWLDNGSEAEERACNQLRKLLTSYDLRRWSFTNQIQIVPFAIPHSHPLLTLNTHYADNDERALATFLHEQIHWFEDSRPAQVAAAMTDLRAMYPQAPVSAPEGAGSAESTYLHLIVCPLEYLALNELLGPERARAVLGRMDVYTWLYRTTLADIERLRLVLTRHGLLI